jgi:dipeptidyl aminopeptidase/acylaminoacyl peptidase
MIRWFVPLQLLALGCSSTYGADAYRLPPKEIVDIVDAAPTPAVTLNHPTNFMLLIDYESMPPISELAKPMLRLAGMRIDPVGNGRFRTFHYTGIRTKRVDDQYEHKLATPRGGRLGYPEWSMNGYRIAFTNATEQGTELWTADVQSGESRRINGPTINDLFGGIVQWWPDNRSLLIRTIPDGRGSIPQKSTAPVGPTVKEAAGKVSKVRTYQDLLQDAHDAELLEYYAVSQLKLVDATTGKTIADIGEPGLYTSVQLSPDGKYLLVEKLEKPFSFNVPYYLFGHSLEIWDSTTGELTKKLLQQPVADEIPIEGVQTGPRRHQWSPHLPATLVWAEALDGGDPNVEAPFRDKLMKLSAPFNGDPKEWMRLEQRYSGIDWCEDNVRLMVTDYDRDRRWIRTQLASLTDDRFQSKVLWERNRSDHYGNPGDPMMTVDAHGQRVVQMLGDDIFLTGRGGSPEGDRPFLDKFNLVTAEKERLFQSPADAYESVVTGRDNQMSVIITRRESKTSPPNYHVRDIVNDGGWPVTDFKDPAPQLTNVRKEIIKYKRADGVDLSGTLYWPPNFKEGETVPIVMWAYPREYTDARVAGQVRTSDQRFTWYRGPSHLFFLTQGYAVLDGPQLPVVGDPETANNTFIEQIVAGAQAAIDKVVEMGVADRDRIGVGGHSYGAFMTANLLAHCDLFRAGIARSGAYNRTLTPFGFQSERRTLWEALNIYTTMAPFFHADKINEPILLIHGAIDNNSGTFPLQSDRMFHALKGHGATVRYVELPFESHGYRARESVMHTLAEMMGWFDKYVKNSGKETSPEEKSAPGPGEKASAAAGR